MMMMNKNPILDELHAVREQLLADAGGTLDALVDRLQTEELETDRPRFRPRRTNRPTPALSDSFAAAKSGDDQLSSPGDR
jgi:hypothetical protein